MKRLSLLLLVFILTTGYAYKGEVIEVKDADTILIKVELWPRFYTEMSIRVYGIDAAEKGTPLGDKAKEYAQFRIAKGRNVHLSNVKEGKFAGRMLASIEIPVVTVEATTSGEHLEDHSYDWATHLLEKGYAKPYFGGSKEGLWSECELNIDCP